MWIWPFLPIPDIWGNCMTESQQIQYLKNCCDELEKRVAALEAKAGVSATESLGVDKTSNE